MHFKQFLARPEFQQWHDQLTKAVTKRSDPKRHGDLAQWLKFIDRLPNVKASHIDFKQDRVSIGRTSDITPEEHQQIQDNLHALSPWRKGPYELFGIHIDTEWRSDWKWQRLIPHISDLQSRHVLDVGCGNGYHCWRMLGAGADYVLGIDPSMRFAIQQKAINKFVHENRFDFAPLGIEDMPSNMPIFDTVFSMGVLYHRRNPINHLIELRNLMRTGAELILETLIVNEGEDNVFDGTLQPAERYAQMRNVWSIMSVQKIFTLLEQANFKNIRCVNQNITSLQEQRSTKWMKFHSLQDFLDPDDLSKTIEGYPAPKRGIFIAEK